MSPSSYETKGMYETGTRRGEVLLPPVHDHGPRGPHARGFGQVFGLHPIPALLTLTLNAMLFTGEVGTLGLFAVVAIPVAVVLGFITYRCQRYMYGDDHQAALVKSWSVALLTAVPTGLPAILTVPSAIAGVYHTVFRSR